MRCTCTVSELCLVFLPSPHACSRTHEPIHAPQAPQVPQVTSVSLGERRSKGFLSTMDLPPTFARPRPPPVQPLPASPVQGQPSCLDLGSSDEGDEAASGAGRLGGGWASSKRGRLSIPAPRHGGAKAEECGREDGLPLNFASSRLAWDPAHDEQEHYHEGPEALGGKHTRKSLSWTQARDLGEGRERVPDVTWSIVHDRNPQVQRGEEAKVSHEGRRIEAESPSFWTLFSGISREVRGEDTGKEARGAPSPLALSEMALASKVSTPWGASTVQSDNEPELHPRVPRLPEQIGAPGVLAVAHTARDGIPPARALSDCASPSPVPRREEDIDADGGSPDARGRGEAHLSEPEDTSASWLAFLGGPDLS